MYTFLLAVWPTARHGPDILTTYFFSKKFYNSFLYALGTFQCYYSLFILFCQPGQMSSRKLPAGGGRDAKICPKKFWALSVLILVVTLAPPTASLVEAGTGKIINNKSYEHDFDLHQESIQHLQHSQSQKQSQEKTGVFLKKIMPNGKHSTRSQESTNEVNYVYISVPVIWDRKSTRHTRKFHFIAT